MSIQKAVTIRPPNTDLGNAERLVARYGSSIRYCWPWRKWLPWDGRRWAIDAEDQILRHAKLTVRAMYTEAAKISDEHERQALIQHAQQSERAARIAAMIDLARSEEPIPIRPESLDQDKYTLNVLNGTLDLRTGELREHRREDFNTKLAPVEYDPDSPCPTWLAFLETIFDGNYQLIDFVQRLSGYCLTADVCEQVLPILWGVGANGKSTLVGTVLAMLGQDYSAKLAPEVVMLRSGEGHPTGTTDLHGKRVVAIVESGEGKRLNEPLVKDLTGGDRIRARRMREDYWEFAPSHKILFATNHRPEIRGTDHAIWRRIRLLPFTITIPDDQQDKDLAQKLRAELPGILAWCVRGCLDWQQHGLGQPQEIKNATDEYRQGQDVLSAFIAEKCVVLTGVKVKAGDLYEAYRSWCESGGEKPVSQTRFGESMTERGFQREKSGVFWRLGIALRTDG